jgi:hypothetical protein
MAKKNTKNKIVVTETVNVETKENILDNEHDVETKENTLDNEYDVETKKEIESVYSMSELVAYEKALRMLCIQYEKIINIDEMERRNQITPNRDKFIRLSFLHKKIMNSIENKVLELEKYEN